MCGSIALFFVEKFDEDRAFGGTVRLVVRHGKCNTLRRKSSVSETVGGTKAPHLANAPHLKNSRCQMKDV